MIAEDKLLEHVLKLCPNKLYNYTNYISNYISTKACLTMNLSQLLYLADENKCSK